jgi:hypothetical protein
VYHTSFLHNKGRLLAGLLDQWVGLRKVLLEHALPQNWTKAKGKNGRLSYFLFHPRQQKVVQRFFWVIYS